MLTEEHAPWPILFPIMRSEYVTSIFISERYDTDRILYELIFRVDVDQDHIELEGTYDMTSEECSVESCR